MKKLDEMKLSMKLLAIDTATEQCSAALLINGDWSTRVVPTARSHAEIILPMIDELLREASLTMNDLDGIAFGRGPGSFTGVRIAVSVAQGLSLATGLPVVPVSNLQAVAQQEIAEQKLASDSQILVCMDARMQEVYWGLFSVDEQAKAKLLGDEHVSPPARVRDELIASGISVDALVSLSCGVGTGWDAYPILREHFTTITLGQARLPRAQEIGELARDSLERGIGVKAADAQPVYLRNNVTHAAK
jgi:tRNA threonylcarbamoyladenosine biosynthesis protein TsaB